MEEKPERGTYILLTQLSQDETIRVGSLEEICFPCGGYAYVGSALGGFGKRLNYHLKRGKNPRWHIDYLLERAVIREILLFETEERVECLVARALSAEFSAIPDFGCSDCRCESHLFFALSFEEMKSSLMAVLSRLGYKVIVAKVETEEI